MRKVLLLLSLILCLGNWNSSNAKQEQDQDARVTSRILWQDIERDARRAFDASAYKNSPGGSRLHRWIMYRHLKWAKHIGLPKNLWVLDRETVNYYVFLSVEWLPVRYPEMSWRQIVASTTTESEWVNRTSDKVRRGKSLPNTLWSNGLMQVQLRTARWNLIERGFTYNITRDDLLNNPALNMDIGCHLLTSYKAKYKTWAIAYQAYNGGENGWKDGRSLNYWSKIKGKWNYVNTWNSF